MLLEVVQTGSDPVLRAIAADALTAAMPSDDLVADLDAVRNLETDPDIRESLSKALEAWKESEGM